MTGSIDYGQMPQTNLWEQAKRLLDGSLAPRVPSRILVN